MLKRENRKWITTNKNWSLEVEGLWNKGDGVKALLTQVQQDEHKHADAVACKQGENDELKTALAVDPDYIKGRLDDHNSKHLCTLGKASSERDIEAEVSTLRINGLLSVDTIKSGCIS